MTCIVGIETPNGVVMGGDSFCGSVHMAETIVGTKVAKRGDWLFGVGGSSRVANLMEHVFKWPKAPRVLDESDAVRLARAIERLLGKDELSHETDKDDGQKGIAAEMMVAARGRIYLVASDLAVFRSSHGYMAIGCGAPYALGALAALPATLPAKDRALAALEAAGRHSSGVRGPFYVVEA